jgi:hypothetical protein
MGCRSRISGVPVWRIDRKPRLLRPDRITDYTQNRSITGAFWGTAGTFPQPEMGNPLWTLLFHIHCTLSSSVPIVRK